MDVSEFDQYADAYLATHAENLRISGEEPEYFARYKIEEVRRRWTASRLAEPRSILDFGAGIGNSWPFLSERFPTAEVTGVDVSEKSLAIAAGRFPGLARPVPYAGGAIPLPDAAFDLIFSACVFHHIPREEHPEVFAELRRLLAPGGRMVIFEHNPVNPATRHIVATCPFDQNAVLIGAQELKRRQAVAGFSAVEIVYTGFFPAPLAALRPLERYLGAVPLGAQYYTLAEG